MTLIICNNNYYKAIIIRWDSATPTMISDPLNFSYFTSLWKKVPVRSGWTLDTRSETGYIIGTGRVVFWLYQDGCQVTVDSLSSLETSGKIQRNEI